MFELRRALNKSTAVSFLSKNTIICNPRNRSEPATQPMFAPTPLANRTAQAPTRLLAAVALPGMRVAPRPPTSVFTGS
jgi:hypothetical protein